MSALNHDKHDRLLNLHFGGDLLLRYVEGKISFLQLISQMEQDERLFKKNRQKYLIYE